MTLGELIHLSDWVIAEGRTARAPQLAALCEAADGYLSVAKVMNHEITIAIILRNVVCVSLHGRRYLQKNDDRGLSRKPGDISLTLPCLNSCPCFIC